MVGDGRLRRILLLEHGILANVVPIAARTAWLHTAGDFFRPGQPDGGGCRRTEGPSPGPGDRPAVRVTGITRAGERFRHWLQPRRHQVGRLRMESPHSTLGLAPDSPGAGRNQPRLGIAALSSSSGTTEFKLV